MIRFEMKHRWMICLESAPAIFRSLRIRHRLGTRARARARLKDQETHPTHARTCRQRPSEPNVLTTYLLFEKFAIMACHGWGISLSLSQRFLQSHLPFPSLNPISLHSTPFPHQPPSIPALPIQQHTSQHSQQSKQHSHDSSHRKQQQRAARLVGGDAS